MSRLPELTPGLALARLRQMRQEYGPPAAEQKREALLCLENAVLTRARDVQLLHDALCFLRAYPDDPETRALADRMLAAFAQREDLRELREELAGSGIAGTVLASSFYWFTADWLARRWPERLTVDWESFEGSDRLDAWMYPLLQEHERVAYDEAPGTLRELIESLKAPEETDAAYLVRCFRGVSPNPLVAEQAYEGLDMPLQLAPGPATPAHTHAVFSGARVDYRSRRWRPSGSVRRRIAEEPLSVRRATRSEAEELYWLGREAMITRGRDLFAFMHADPGDTRLVDFGDGLVWSCMGLVPERRHLLYGQYILLALQNGVPVAYSQACPLFDSAEINFNVFESFRDGEASRIFTTSLALTRHLFGVDAFTINTHQLGQDNPEALKTGAWWFYHKHGFRPDAPHLRDIVARERAAKKRDPKHRSSLATLRQLSADEMFLFLGRPRRACLNKIDLSAIGISVARRVGERYGVSGPAATRVCAREARRLLDVRASLDSWSRGEKLAWRRWAPLVVALDVEDWSSGERRRLVRAIRAKGGPRESDFVRLFRQHEPLQRGVLALAKPR